MAPATPAAADIGGKRRPVRAMGTVAGDGAWRWSWPQRTALRRWQRKAAALSLRSQLERTRLELRQVQQVLAAGWLEDDLGPREAAAVRALRIHRGACTITGVDDHAPAAALQRAGLLNDDTRRIIRAGAVARHRGLATVDDAAFRRLSDRELRRLQRGRRAWLVAPTGDASYTSLEDPPDLPAGATIADVGEPTEAPHRPR